MSGINAVFRFIHRKEAMILWYHGICGDDYPWHDGTASRLLPRSHFRRHLEFLKQKGCRFVTLTELASALEEKRDTSKFVTLTFDEGLENVVTNAYPVMQELGAKGCVFVCSDLIGTNRLLWSDHVRAVLDTHPEPTFRFEFRGRTIVHNLASEGLRLAAEADIMRRLQALCNCERIEHLRQFADDSLGDRFPELQFASCDQLRQLDRSVFEVAGHTRTHPDCSSLGSEAEFEDELVTSKEEIENGVGCRVTHFAYPYGRYDDNVVAHVKEAGYESAVSVLPGFNDAATDRYQLRRFCAGREHLLFKASTSGSCDFLLRMGRRLGRRR